MAYKPLEWEAQESVHTEKSSDWYWAVGIITIAAVVTCVILGNILFGLVILLGSAGLTMHAAKEPPLHYYKLDEHGIHIDDTYYPYRYLDSYWIDENYYPVKALLKSKKFFMPYLVMAIPDNVDIELVRKHFDHHLPAHEHHEPLPHKILEYLGF
ncbi:MAG TPA: hypothetical protein VHF05_00125 [Candidatus Paceibacterota bacterium]|nr:hypothetical protein [Candidatus Paceibacterota bacterium]